MTIAARHPKPRPDPRAKILDTAERLFAAHGIDAVSLREIANGAGQKNTSAAHYYFKDKQGLVAALIADRIAKVERLRQKLLDAVERLEDCDETTLLRMMWAPMLDICQQQGGNQIIQFHLTYHLSDPAGRIAHPILSDPAQFPASSCLLAALEGKYAALAPEQLRYRLGVVFMMFWVAASRHDASPAISTEEKTIFPLDEIIRMAVGALAAS
jgi:AcrR family transcriptional regulator